MIHFSFCSTLFPIASERFKLGLNHRPDDENSAQNQYLANVARSVCTSAVSTRSYEPRRWRARFQFTRHCSQFNWIMRRHERETQTHTYTHQNAGRAAVSVWNSLASFGIQCEWQLCSARFGDGILIEPVWKMSRAIYAQTLRLACTYAMAHFNALLWCRQWQTETTATRKNVRNTF